MKCKFCGGSGEDNWMVGTVFLPCPVCNGTGVVEPLTNDEWRRNCSTEEFADWIADVLFSEDFKKHIHNMGYANMHSYKTEVLDWLKEKHKND